METFNENGLFSNEWTNICFITRRFLNPCDTSIMSFLLFILKRLPLSNFTRGIRLLRSKLS